MLAEFLYHFFAFDFNWLVGFIFNPANLMWLFLFTALAFFFYCNNNGKSLFWATVFVTFYLWASTDFSKEVGWQLFNADLLTVLMIAGFVTMAFFSNDSWGKDRLPMINTLRFILIFIIFNLFI